jgi:hypothetical protein
MLSWGASLVFLCSLDRCKGTVHTRSGSASTTNTPPRSLRSRSTTTASTWQLHHRTRTRRARRSILPVNRYLFLLRSGFPASCTLALCLIAHVLLAETAPAAIRYRCSLSLRRWQVARSASFRRMFGFNFVPLISSHGQSFIHPFTLCVFFSYLCFSG